MGRGMVEVRVFDDRCVVLHRPEEKAQVGETVVGSNASSSEGRVEVDAPVSLVAVVGETISDLPVR